MRVGPIIYAARARRITTSFDPRRGPLCNLRNICHALQAATIFGTASAMCTVSVRDGKVDFGHTESTQKDFGQALRETCQGGLTVIADSAAH